MAGRHRIMCIEKGPGTLPHQVVTHVGGRTSAGKRWKISLAEAIGGMREGVWSFYVVIAGETLEIQIARDGSGVHYLRTEIDGEGPVSLLQLPECSLFAAKPDADEDAGGEDGGSHGGSRSRTPGAADDDTWP